MNIPKVLLDTDILSKVLRGEPLVLAQATAYLQQHTKFTFSLITQYEILRGLKAKTALVQLQRFQQFCVSCEILPLTEEIIGRFASFFKRFIKMPLMAPNDHESERQKSKESC